MAQIITLTIPDDKALLIGDSFDEVFINRPEGVNKSDWVKQKIIEYIQKIVKDAERQRIYSSQSDITIS